MKSAVRGPFVIISKSDQAEVDSLDELDDSQVIFTTEDGNLIELKESFGAILGNTSDPKITMTIYDPHHELLLKWFSQGVNNFESFLKHYNPTATTTNQSDERRYFYIKYGIGKIRKGVPFKKCHLTKIHLIQDYAETNMVKLYFTLVTNVNYNQSEFHHGGGPLGEINPLDIPGSTSESRNNSLILFPDVETKTREYAVWDCDFQNIPTGTLAYFAPPPTKINVDNFVRSRINITGLLEMMFQHFLMLNRPGTELGSTDPVPLIILPTQINAKLADIIVNSYQGTDEYNQEAARITAFTKVMQNAGFVVSREIDGLSPSISLYGQPFNVKLTLQFQHSPGENRLITVKRLINSLLDELGIPKDIVNLQALTINDPIVCEKLESIMFSSKKDFYLVNSKDGTVASNLRYSNIRKHGMLILCDKFLVDLLKTPPDSILQNYAGKLVAKYKQAAGVFNNYAESAKYCNLPKFLGSAESYIRDLVNHYMDPDEVEDEEDLDIFAYADDKNGNNQKLNSLIELYKVGQSSDKVLDFKVMNKEAMPILGEDFAFKFITDPVVSDPGAFFLPRDIDPSSPLTDEDINYLMNQLYTGLLASNGPNILAALDVIGVTPAQLNTASLADVRKALENIKNLFKDRDISKTAIANYLATMGNVYKDQKIVEIKIRPEFKKYAHGVKKYVFLKIANQDPPLEPLNEISRTNYTRGIFAVERVDHILSKDESYTKLGLTETTVSQLVTEADYDKIEAFYDAYFGENLATGGSNFL